MIAASLGDLAGGAVRANDQSSVLKVQRVRAPNWQVVEHRMKQSSGERLVNVQE
jgi:hypothetical protein